MGQIRVNRKVISSLVLYRPLIKLLLNSVKLFRYLDVSLGMLYKMCISFVSQSARARDGYPMRGLGNLFVGPLLLFG